MHSYERIYYCYIHLRWSVSIIVYIAIKVGLRFWYEFKQLHLIGETVKGAVVRALALENSNFTLFYHSKKSLYHYTISFFNTFTSQNSIFIKILFFNLSLLLLSNCHFFSKFQLLHHHQSPHHTSTSTALPSSITTPPPKCFCLSSYTLHN